jgi:hypothetical protein
VASTGSVSTVHSIGNGSESGVYPYCRQARRGQTCARTEQRHQNLGGATTISSRPAVASHQIGGGTASVLARGVHEARAPSNARPPWRCKTPDREAAAHTFAPAPPSARCSMVLGCSSWRPLSPPSGASAVPRFWNLPRRAGLRAFSPPLLPTCFPSSTTRVPRFVARFVERSKHHMVWSRACHGGEPRGGGDSESRARRGIADGMARKVNSASKVQPSGAGGGGAIANSALSRANSTLEFCAHLIGPVRWGVRAPRGGLWCTLVVLSVVWSGSPLLSPPFPLSVATSPSSPVAPMRSQAGVLQSAIHHTACGCPRLHPRPHTHTHTHTHTHSDRSFRHLCIVSRSSRGGRGRGPGQGVGTDHGS